MLPSPTQPSSALIAQLILCIVTLLGTAVTENNMATTTVMSTTDATSSNFTIHCPSYIFIHKDSFNSNISCNVSFPNIKEPLYRPDQLLWLAGNDIANPEFKLKPNETHDRYMFSLKQLDESTFEAVLIFKYIDSRVDYRNYTLALNDSPSIKEFPKQSLRLYERGQGKATFAWFDYVIFLSTIVIYGVFGIYYAFIKPTRIPPGGDYILGDRNTGWLPNSFSLLGTFLSAVVMMGTTTEVYANGTQYLTTAISYPFVCAVSSHILLPIFYKLKLTSVHEYLELRFNKAVRVSCSLIFLVQMTLYMSLVIYVPSIALQTCMGVNFWFFALTVTGICVFYTAFGGLKANGWLDIIQACGYYIGMIVIFALGCVREGGFEVAWQKASNRGRTIFWNWDPDPRWRHSFWTTTIGMFVTWIYTYGISQTQVEVGLMAKTLKDGQITFWMNVPLNILMILFPSLIAILAIARYQDCDPVNAGIIEKYDDILVYYVIDIVAEDLPGLAGFFVVTLCCAALSGLSCGLTGLVAVTCRDFGIEALLRRRGFSANKMYHVSKGVSAFYGILSILLVFPIQYAPGLLESVISLTGALGGPVLGVFLCGIFVPWINANSVFAGLFIAIGLTVWNGLGEKMDPQVDAAQWSPSSSTLACDWQSSDHPPATYIPTKVTDFSQLQGVENWYAVSYLYFSIIGVFVVGAVGVIVSAITGWHQEHNLTLLHPLVHKFVLRRTNAPASTAMTTLRPSESTSNGRVSSDTSYIADSEAACASSISKVSTVGTSNTSIGPLKNKTEPFE